MGEDLTPTPTLPNVHDAVMEGVEIDWQGATATVRLTLVPGPPSTVGPPSTIALVVGKRRPLRRSEQVAERAIRRTTNPKHGASYHRSTLRAPFGTPGHPDVHDLDVHNETVESVKLFAPKIPVTPRTPEEEDEDAQRTFGAANEPTAALLMWLWRRERRRRAAREHGDITNVVAVAPRRLPTLPRHRRERDRILASVSERHRPTPHEHGEWLLLDFSQSSDPTAARSDVITWLNQINPEWSKYLKVYPRA